LWLIKQPLEEIKRKQAFRFQVDRIVGEDSGIYLMERRGGRVSSLRAEAVEYALLNVPLKAYFPDPFDGSSMTLCKPSMNLNLEGNSSSLEVGRGKSIRVKWSSAILLAFLLTHSPGRSDEARKCSHEGAPEGQAEQPSHKSAASEQLGMGIAFVQISSNASLRWRAGVTQLAFITHTPSTLRS
jgi:hypothetical protein